MSWTVFVHKNGLEIVYTISTVAVSTPGEICIQIMQCHQVYWHTQPSMLLSTVGRIWQYGRTICSQTSHCKEE